MKILISFSVFFFLTGAIAAEPCLDYACDSSIVREILDGNGLDTVAVHAVTGSIGSRIDTLNLTGRGVITLPGSIGNLSALKCLLLGCIRFSGIPHDPICNSLDSLPGEIATLTELVSLGLDGNNLTTLPTAVGGLKKLKNLNVEHNKLASLPAAIGDLTELETVRLGYNPLPVLPDEIGALNHLRYFSLYATDTRQLPHSIGNWSNLQFIVIANTKLTSLPDEFCDLASLEQAELYRNKLASLPDSMVKMNNLNLLFVEYNRLCFLSNNLKAWLDEHNSGWETTQDCSTTVKARNTAPRSIPLLKSRIKSLPGFIEITYNLNRNSNIKIEIFNVQGRLLYTANEGYRAAGIHHVKVSTGNKMKGMIFARITGDIFKATKEIAL